MSPYDRAMQRDRDFLNAFLDDRVLGRGICADFIIHEWPRRAHGPGHEVVVRRPGDPAAYTFRWGSVSDRGIEYYALVKVETPDEVREIVVTRKTR